MRIASAVFIGLRLDSHQRRQTITATNTKASPQLTPQIKPVWNPTSRKASEIFILVVPDAVSKRETAKESVDDTRK